MDRERGIRNDFKRLGRALALLCHAVAFSAEVFLRRGFGPGYVGTQAATVPAIVLCYGLFWRDRNLLPLFAFLALYLAMGAEALISGHHAKKKGVQVPECYSGAPRIRENIFPCLSESAIKRLVEPLYVLVVGLNTAIFDAPLAVYLMITSGAMLISANLRHFRERRSQAASTPSAPLRVEVKRIPHERDCQPDRSSPTQHTGVRP